MKILLESYGPLGFEIKKRNNVCMLNYYYY